MNEIVRLVKLLLQERELVIVSVTVGGLAALLNLSRPILLGRIIQMVTDKSFICAYEFLILMFVFSWILSWLNSIILNYLSTKVSHRILKNMRISILDHFLSLPLMKSERVKEGDIETYSVSDAPG